MSQIIDISPTINELLAVWPGDTPFQRDSLLALQRGDNIDLSTMHTTVHLGAHADARSHYQRGGNTIDQMDLDAYFGRCQVIEVSVPMGHRIYPQDLKTEIREARILLKTHSYPNPQHFNKDFNSLSKELVDKLAEHGVVLVGIDTPSIDPFDDKALESHQAIQNQNIVNLEGLVLAHVPEGIYTLVALPLKIQGADASPVRAVLIK